MKKHPSKDSLHEQIYKTIESNWPIHATGIAKHLGFEITEQNQKQVLGKIKYHIDKLEEQEKVISKKIAGAKVVWPMQIERIRFIEEMMR